MRDQKRSAFEVEAMLRTLTTRTLFSRLTSRTLHSRESMSTISKSDEVLIKLLSSSYSTKCFCIIISPDAGEQLKKTEAKLGAHNYEPLPVVLSKGQGAYVWDVEGKRYLDFLSAYSAVNQVIWKL